MFDTKELARREKRTVAALTMERCRAPEQHPPFVKVGPLVRYDEDEYRRWKDGLPAGKQSAEEILLTLTAKQRKAIDDLETAIRKLKASLLEVAPMEEANV